MENRESGLDAFAATGSGNRRDLFKAAGTVSMAAFGLILTACGNRLLNALPSEQYLVPTAVALESEGKQDSFTPGEGFTEEMFRQAQRSTFRIEIYLKSGDVAGTAWLAHVSELDHYFVTNNHVAQMMLAPDFEEIQLLRPGIDTNPLVPNGDKGFNVTYFTQPDLAVIRIQMQPPEPFPTLSWVDNTLPKVGTSLLIVGFPGALETSEGNQLTEGMIMKVLSSNPISSEWVADGFTPPGSSGSPALAIINGEPVVTGIVWGHGSKDVLVTNNDIQQQNTAVGYALRVQDLINSFNSG